MKLQKSDRLSPQARQPLSFEVSGAVRFDGSAAWAGSA